MINLKIKFPFKNILSTTLFLVVLSLGISVGNVRASIFDAGGSPGGIFEGFRRGIEDIFEGFRGLLPGGAVIPGISPIPTLEPGVSPPSLPPLALGPKGIKLTLEWDALSLGAEAVDPDGSDPLSDEHIDFIRNYGCPPCPAVLEDPPEHERDPEITPWHVCAVQLGCFAREIEHSLYGWCGHDPNIIGNVPGQVQQAFEGPNTYTLPGTVSNKYVRRDGYTYQCFTECDGYLCPEVNYMEFQTMIYPSNNISLYVRAENTSDQPIDNILIRVKDKLSGEPLPQNVDYPDGGDYVHGNNVAFTQTINGMLLRTVGGEILIGPFHLPPGQSRWIPLQPTSSEQTSIPGTASLDQDDQPLAGKPDLLAGLFNQVVEYGQSIVEEVNSVVKDVKKLDPVTPQKATAQAEWCSCVGDSLADYMNTVASGFSCGAASLSSPVYNLSAPSMSCITEAMRNAGANFGNTGVVMGNAYNTCDGRTVSDYVNLLKQKFPGKKIYLTELGAINIEQGCVGRDTGIQQLKDQMDLIRNDPDVIGAALFNSFGYNPGFSYNIFSDTEIGYLCSGDCGGFFGINTARPVGTTDPYSRAAGLNMGSVVEIVAADQIDGAVAAFQNAQANGLTPILRIGIGNNSGGFDDPDDYVQFLNDLAQRLGNCNFIAIAGPNEPSLEAWANNGCGTVTGEYVGQLPDSYTPGTWDGWYHGTDVDPGEPISPIDLQGKLGKGGIIPRDFNFVCDDDDDSDADEDDRCGGAGMPDYIIDKGSSEFEEYRDVTGIGSCGYWASSNNSVIGPLEITAEYGSLTEDRTSRSVLLASIPIGGRFVDVQSRPYGWPTTGRIEQDWGYTGDAEAQGSYRSNPAYDYGEFRLCQ